MTITDPAGAVSTKWEDSFGADASEPRTICTVYAGPQIRVFPAFGADGDGDSIWMSGMCPPCGTPSLMRASEISQVENWESELVDEVDIARKRGCRLPNACFMLRRRRQSDARM